MYIEITIENVIKKTEKGFKALLITEPRQVGKSTVLKHLYNDKKYSTFDDPVLLSETKREPELAKGKYSCIADRIYINHQKILHLQTRFGN